MKCGDPLSVAAVLAESKIKSVAAAVRADKSAMEAFRWLWNNADAEGVQVGMFEKFVAKVLAHAAGGPAASVAEGPWKVGNEFLPYHPDASHVPPDYRDGWNACYRASPPEGAGEVLGLLREAREVLANLLDRINLNGGLGEYKGGPPFARKAAAELLTRLDAALSDSAPEEKKR